MISLTPRDHPMAAPAPRPPPPPPAPLTAKGPVGWDVYRRLDLLPMLTRGVETRQFSSFDRRERNDDFSHCLRLAPDGCVIAEHSGPGEVDRMWFTRDFGDVGGTGSIDVELDGRVVLYTSLQALVDGVLGPPFVFPLVADAARSSGGNLVMVPMPFRTSMRIVTDVDPVYYQVTYRVFADAAGVRTFDPSDRALDVIAKLLAAGAADPKPAQPGAATTALDVGLAPGASVLLADLAGPSVIDGLRLRLPPRSPPDVLENLRLRVVFDGQRTVDAPLAQFFGSGFGGGVAALMFAMDPGRSGWLSAWWPMPYRSRATVELANESPVAVPSVHAEVTAAPDPRWDAWLGASPAAGYFRADSHTAATIPGADYPFLDATGTGKLVGVSVTLRGPDSRVYLEGNERTYVDGSRTPQLPGTGTEDFFGGGWYFDHGTFSDPFNGEPANPHGTPACAADCTDAYRVMLADAVPFASSIAFGIEHGGHDDVAATYSSTAFWYGQDGPSLRLDGVLPVASGAPLTGTYEGNDGAPAPLTMAVRATSAPVHLALTLPPDNDGVVLRRTSDQRTAYQSATVLVDGRAIGVWLEPLGNPYHRWLDDAFLLPASVTAGRERLDVTLVPTRGAPSWTAARYEVLSYAGME